MSLGGIEQSPTSASSQGSAPEAHLDPPCDPRAHQLPHGHCGICPPVLFSSPSSFCPLESVSFVISTCILRNPLTTLIAALLPQWLYLFCHTCIYYVFFKHVISNTTGYQRHTIYSNYFQEFLSRWQGAGHIDKKKQPHKIHLGKAEHGGSCLSFHTREFLST